MIKSSLSLQLGLPIRRCVEGSAKLLASLENKFKEWIYSFSHFCGQSCGIFFSDVPFFLSAEMALLLPKARMGCRVHHVPRPSTIPEVILQYDTMSRKATVISAKKIRCFCW